MTTSIAQIDLWLQLPTETQTLEFKEAQNTYDWEKLQKYCVAISNEGGGHLVLGITDQAPRRIVGSAAFPDPIAKADELFHALGFRVDIEVVNHPDGRVLVFHIPPRPKGTARNLKGTYLMRAGASLVPMSEDRLRSIFAEGGPNWLDEPSLSNLDGQQIVDLLDTQSFFELLKLPYPSSREGVINRFLQDRLIDQKDGMFSVRRCFALMFAKRLADFPDVARKAARVIVYKGINKLETRIDQIGVHGYASGFQSLISFVMGQLPQNEVIKDALRESVKLLPEDAIRELIANALIHQDFTVAGAGPAIEIYANRVEISNPGAPLVPVDRFIDGYQSRNEHLTDVMRRMKICEERSSGIDRVVHTVEVYQLPAPEFRAELGRTTVIVHGLRDFEDMTRDDRIRACYQHCALKFVTREKTTNESLRLRFGLPTSRAAVASQVIAATIEAGKIKPDESVGASKKFARYLPHWA